MPATKMLVTGSTSDPVLVTQKLRELDQMLFAKGYMALTASIAKMPKSDSYFFPIYKMGGTNDEHGVARVTFFDGNLERMLLTVHLAKEAVFTEYDLAK